MVHLFQWMEQAKIKQNVVLMGWNIQEIEYEQIFFILVHEMK